MPANQPAHISHDRPIPGSKAVFANPLGLIALAALGGFSAYKGAAGIAGLCAVLVAAGLMARLWGWLALKGLTFKAGLSQSRAFPGEQITLNLRLANNKLLPLSWVEASYRIPAQLAADSVPDDGPESRPWSWLKVRTPLLWYQWAEFPFSLICRTRGVYDLGPVTVTSGDIFGLLIKERKEAAQDELIVYPRIYDLSKMGLPARFPLGATRAANRLFEDPARSVGLRDYVPGTPLKYIHWKASARQQRLQVKVFEPTTSLQLAVFIDVESFSASKDQAPFELAVSTAASLAWQVINQAQPVGVFANGLQQGRGNAVAIKPRTGHAHLARILETLARLQAKPSDPLPDMLKLWTKAVMPGDTLIIIAAEVSDSLAQRLDILKAQGFKVRVFMATGPATEPSSGSPWREARSSNGQENMRATA